MALELHVWGPIGDVPSIDAECLAAIAFFSHCVPTNRWRLVRSNNPSICPANLLPALRHGKRWTSGYTSIVSYLSTLDEAYNLDSSLTTLQTSRSRAFAAFLASNIHPLLDLAMFVSEDNWDAVTLPGYTKLVRFPLSWTVPHMVRDEGVGRASQTGLVAAVERLESGKLPEDENEEVTVKTGILDITGNFTSGRLGGRESVAQIFTKRKIEQRIRESVSGDLQKVEEMLQIFHQDFPKAGDVRSIDFLAYGYLALMTDLTLPRDFCQSLIREQHPGLQAFVASMKTTCFDAKANVISAADVSFSPSALQVTTRFVDTIIQHIPVLGKAYDREKTRRASLGITGVDARAAMLTAGFLLSGATLWGSYFLYRRMQPFGAPAHVWTIPRRPGFGRM